MTPVCPCHRGGSPYAYWLSVARAIVADVTGSASGQVLSHVEAAGSKLKVWTLLNGDAATDDAPAKEVCRAVKASGVPEADGAVLPDAGNALLRRCWQRTTHSP
jgi:hypothetical protein